MDRIKFLLTSIAAACLLAACGGKAGSTDSEAGLATENAQSSATPANTLDSPQGSSDAPVAQPAQPDEGIQGIWTGSLQMEDKIHGHPYIWDATAVGLDDGRIFIAYSQYYHTDDEPARNSFGGLLAGKGTAQSGNFSLDGGKDFSFVDGWPSRSASLSATYSYRDLLKGRISYPRQADGSTPTPRDFSTRYDKGSIGAAKIENIAFNNTDHRSVQGILWTPKKASWDASYKTELHLVVEKDGTLKSRFEYECQVSGSLQPHSRQNLFIATITFESFHCPYQGQTLRGAAFFKDSVPTKEHPEPTKNRFHLVAATENQDGVIGFSQIVLRNPK